MFGITPSARLRPSPYFEATLAESVTAFTTYNHMLMPTSFGQPEAEYWRLINGVSQWDVAVERQVQTQGPDAGRLAQILTARNLSKIPDRPRQICTALQSCRRTDQWSNPVEAFR